MRLETLSQINFPNISVRIMASVLDEHGIDPVRAAHVAGLSRQDIDAPNRVITGRQELDFQRAFVELTPGACEIWFEAGLKYRLLAYGPFGFAMMTARTLRRALELSGLFRDLHFSLVTHGALVMDGRLRGITMDAALAPEPLREFSIYRDLGAVTTMLNDLWQGPFPFTQITLALPEPPARAVFDHALQAPLQFGAPQNAWMWADDLEDVLLPMGNAVCEEAYERQCKDIVASCKFDTSFAQSCLETQLRSGGAYLTSDQLAAVMHVSERTLQRRLHADGLSYRAILDKARFSHARELLRKTALTVEQVAATLGYSEPAAFTHAFARWSGESPSAFRRAPSAD